MEDRTETEITEENFLEGMTKGEEREEEEIRIETMIAEMTDTREEGDITQMIQALRLPLILILLQIQVV
jgi:hypothetical protein